MKNIKKLPTILGLLILITGLIAGITLINSRQVFKLGANVEATPKNVRLSNITDNSVTVTWTTDIESEGFVKWGTSELSLSKVALGEVNGKSLIHSATIQGINSGSDILFKINSNSKDYDNELIPWKATTYANPPNSTNTFVATGTVLDTNGSTPAKAIVYITVDGVVLSAVTSENGSYVIPISTYINQVVETQAIEISVQSGKSTAQAVIYPSSVKHIPVIIMGRSYDFRTVENLQPGQEPTSQLNVPESIELSSRFEVTKNNSTNSEIKNVTLESVEEGEIVTSTEPEFFGTGPANTEITIEIRSELQTETIKTSNQGRWSWSPPSNLEPGEHTLTIKWRGADGILRTLTRSFVVSAAEGPAFVATPSATPLNQSDPTQTPTSTQTPTQTIVPTAIATIISSPTSIPTNQPVPQTGSLTPTIGLFIMGIGLLFGSIYLAKQNA